MDFKPPGPRRLDTHDQRSQIHADAEHTHDGDDEYDYHSLFEDAHEDSFSLSSGDEDDYYSPMEDEGVSEEDAFICEDDDDRSTLSVPIYPIDFDVVYALQNFAATVEGQANVVKGDHLDLLDDTNKYWWLVRVHKTQEVGYIPAENIETPFERLARLNKHRNGDLTKATQFEEQDEQIIAGESDLPLRHNIQFGNGPYPFPYPSRKTPSPQGSPKSIHFNVVRLKHYFIPTSDTEEDEEEIEWDEVDYEEVDEDLLEEQVHWKRRAACDEEDDKLGGIHRDSSTEEPQDIQPIVSRVSDGISEAPSDSFERGPPSPTETSTQEQETSGLHDTLIDLRAGAAPSVGPITPEPTPAFIPQDRSVLSEREETVLNLFMQSLLRSPTKPQSYGLQSASSAHVSSPSTSSSLDPPASVPRPGALIPKGVPGTDSRANLSLTVIRVFAGTDVPTESTFKTVLLNPLTTASELVKQAVQRFRLPPDEDPNDYYLTMRQVTSGDSVVLHPRENPLAVLDAFAMDATRLSEVDPLTSTIGRNITSPINLPIHQNAKKLSTDSFTDDSVIKFYLDKKGFDSSAEAEALHLAERTRLIPRERFTSSSIRFAVQLVICAKDLPDNMQFHPQTNAIVLKQVLQNNSQIPALTSPVLQQKVFIFHQNTTVADATEIGLQRFGIREGITDGGDDVENRITRRRRDRSVQYCLMLCIGLRERELVPSSRLIDAFPRAPQCKVAGKQETDVECLLLDGSNSNIPGYVDNSHADLEDPVFALRKAARYRNSSRQRRWHRTELSLLSTTPTYA